MKDGDFAVYCFDSGDVQNYVSFWAQCDVALVCIMRFLYTAVSECDSLQSYVDILLTET